MGGNLSLNEVEEARLALGYLRYIAYMYDAAKYTPGGFAEAANAIDVLKHYVDKPRHVIGASVLITDGNGNVLLGKRNKDIQGGGLYSTPGGKIDLGENILDGAVREVKEECGIDISAYRDQLCILGHKQHHRYGDHSVIFYVYARITDPILLCKIENTEPDKCDGWELFSLGDLPEANCMTEPEEFIHALRVREEQN